MYAGTWLQQRSAALPKKRKGRKRLAQQVAQLASGDGPDAKPETVRLVWLATHLVVCARPSFAGVGKRWCQELADHPEQADEVFEFLTTWVPPGLPVDDDLDQMRIQIRASPPRPEALSWSTFHKTREAAIASRLAVDLDAPAAIGQLEQHARTFPHDIAGLQELSALRAREGREAEVDRCTAEILARRPFCIEANLRVAVTRKVAGDVEGATRCIERAYAAEPLRPDVLAFMAMSTWDTGEESKATAYALASLLGDEPSEEAALMRSAVERMRTSAVPQLVAFRREVEQLAEEWEAFGFSQKADHLRRCSQEM